MTALTTPWERGRLDARVGPRSVLFGRMYEDATVEELAFRGHDRVFCIASAGCTALALCAEHDVVACDVNEAQLDYAARRIEGAPPTLGVVERAMSFARMWAPLVGWRRAVLDEFLALEDVDRQLPYWRAHLDTWRFRTGFDALLSVATLRALYSKELLSVIPRRFGAVIRGRMERSFALHPNATNVFARALLAGGGAPEESSPRPPGDRARITLVHADAASYLEGAPSGSFDAFTFSNILDGVSPTYRHRLARAVRRAASPDAVVVLRTFAEPSPALPEGAAAQDRSMLWGAVDVRRIDDREAWFWREP